MSGFEVLVTNKSPETRKDVARRELELFQRYMKFKTGSENFYPFEHQAEAFKTISNGENALLVAGTAAGKTLAVAIPVFNKLLQGEIKKLMFLYPTIALLEDQQRVLLDIAKLVNLEDEVGYIQGGMTRGRLISNLSKKIIVATPDSVYWFFRKNIKYSSLLIYGLSCVDEFILDEAHVFSGLTIQKLKLFFERIQILRKRFMKKSFRLHILTATPREEIFSLNKGNIINGRSKCEDVKVSFYNVSPFEKSDKYKDLALEATKKGYKKILVIQNSAMNAHRLFRDISDFKARQSLSPEQYMQFGRIRKSTLEGYLRSKRVSKEKIQKLYNADEDDIDYRLNDFENVKVLTEAQHLYETLRNCFYTCRGKTNQVLYGMFKGKFDKKFSFDTFLIRLKKKDKALRRLFSALNNEKNKDNSFAYYELKDLINTSFESFLGKLEDRVDAVSPVIEYPSLDIVDQILPGLDAVIIDYIKNAFARDFCFKKSAILDFEGRFPRKTSQYIYLKWLKSRFGEFHEEICFIITNLIKEDKSFREKIEMNHVGIVRNSDYPIIVYSGSMSRSAREGLIALFDELERAVLISTSAVEVGVDFDADLLITEQCECGAFMQRFGRVGRGTDTAAAWVIVNGESYGNIKDKAQRSLTREEFTEAINATFRNRKSIGDSRLLEASFVNVNRQLGEIGSIINEDSKIPRQSMELAKELEEKYIELNYGLRSTLPSVSLLDKGVTKDVFQLLQYLPTSDLEVTSDGFEIAKANISFIELLYAKREWQVFVDLDETLENCEIVFSNDARKNKISIIKSQDLGRRKYGLIRQMIDTHKLETHPHLIYGDIYLKRKSENFFEQPKVVDAYDTPVTIPKQFCLIFPGISDINLLTAKGFADIEEIYYDVDFDGMSKNGQDLVLLDNVQGACLSLYKIMTSQGR